MPKNPLAPFRVDPVLTGISIAYTNENMIADHVLPRVPVAKQAFEWRKYDIRDGFTIPDTHVGRTSRPIQVEFGFEVETDSTVNYAIEDPIPNDDILNAPKGFNPTMYASEQLSKLLVLSRESRVAQLVFNPASYASQNVTTLTGNVQWSDPASSPVPVILDALDKVVMRPNIGILGRAVWTKLRQHPKIVSAILANPGESGVVALNAVADLLELDAIFVGEAWLNTVNRGQDPQLARAWGKHAAFIYRDSLATASTGMTFGFTAQWGQRVAGLIDDPNIGMRGGQVVRVGESVKELICAKDVGYFFQNAVA